MAELDLGKVTGEQGPQGIPGSQWYQGTAVTGEATSGTVFPDSGVLNAVVNDKYWNTDTNNVYTCVLGGDSSTAQWAYVGNIQGPQGNIGPIGPTGNPGTAATIQVGEVTSGDVASVENTGTSTAAVFDFVLPKGDPGPQGPKGEKGDTGEPANITGAASSIIENNLSANRALISDGSGKVAASGVTSTELGYLDGVTSGIQSQLDALNSNFTYKEFVFYDQEVTSGTPGTRAAQIVIEPSDIQIEGYRPISAVVYYINTSLDVIAIPFVSGTSESILNYTGYINLYRSSGSSVTVNVAVRFTYIKSKN